MEGTEGKQRLRGGETGASGSGSILFHDEGTGSMGTLAVKNPLSYTLMSGALALCTLYVDKKICTHTNVAVPPSNWV